MDKYIDDFCEKHFPEFEVLGVKNVNDALFDNPRLMPTWFVRIALGVSIAMIAASFFIPIEVQCKATLLKDIGVGLLASSLVALWFEQRDRSIRYYEKIIGIINLRMRSIEEARSEAAERVLNDSAIEGLQLLQFTAQNACGFAGYLEDKIGCKVAMGIVEGVVVERDLGGELSEEEIRQHIRTARRTIGDLLKRLDRAKLAIRTNMWGQSRKGKAL